MATPKRKVLGKGLDALFEDNMVETKAVTQLKISQIEPNSAQPRSQFDEKALRELADSIESHGVLQPLVVRPINGGSYQIVAGERRWRASRLVGLTEIPVVIRELSDQETLEIGIIENLQREDLNPVELALGYKNLMDNHNMTQEEVAKKVGKSRPVVANTVRLLSLPNEILQLLEENQLTSGHARAILALEDPQLMIQTANEVAGKGLPVREIENLAKKLKAKEEKSSSSKVSRRPNVGWGNSYYKEMELALKEELGRKVVITQLNGKTTLSLDFYSKEELDNFVARIIKEEK